MISFEERRCSVCGCTDDDACEGGCFWVSDNLCSSCVIVGVVEGAEGGQ